MAIRSANPGGAYDAPPATSGGNANNAITLSQSYRVQLPNGQTVTVGSQAEVDSLRAAYNNPNPIVLGGNQRNDNPVEWLETATDSLSAVTGYLQGSAYRRRLEDLDDTRAEMAQIRTSILAAVQSNPELQPFLNLMDVQSKMHDAEIRVLESQIVAVDLATGGAATKVIARLYQGGGGSQQGGGGNGPLLLGAGAIGLGLLASNNRRNNRR